MSSNIIHEENKSIYLREFQNLRSEIISLKKDINKALEVSRHHHMDALLLEMKGDLSRPVIHYMLEDTKETVETCFYPDCEKSDLCKPAFLNLLQEMALLLLEDRVTEDSLLDLRDRFNGLKELAVTENCDACVKSASRLFDKQMELIRSFNRSAVEEPGSVTSMPLSSISDDVVTEICEPLANKQRLAILRLVNSEAKSFSEISKSTGLRGGNLLFHIQKLIDTGMILQRTERGDYMITKKGYMTLKVMAELYDKLSNS